MQLTDALCPLSESVVVEQLKIPIQASLDLRATGLHTAVAPGFVGHFPLLFGILPVAHLVRKQGQLIVNKGPPQSVVGPL